MNKIFSFVFVTILLVLVYVNFLVFKSYMFQFDLIQEFNNGIRSENTLKKFENQNFLIPNITVTALPLYPMLADYYLKLGDYNSSIEILNKKVNDNPFLYFKETVKAKYFIETQVRDSALFYSNIAYYALPLNVSNFKDLSVVLTFEDNVDGLVEAFNFNQKNKSTDFWKIYLSSLIIMSNKTVLPDELKQDLSSKYFTFSDNEILSYLDIILLGPENVDKAQSLINKADSLFSNGKFLSAAKLYLESLEYNPNQYSSYENAALSFMNIQMFKEANDSYNNLVSKFPNITPKSNYYYGYILSKLDRRDEACKYISKAYKANYKESVKLYNNICL